LKITKYDLIQIQHETMQAFKTRSSQDLESREFVTDCYVEAVLSFLHRNGVEVTLEKDYFKTHIIKG